MLVFFQWIQIGAVVLGQFVGNHNVLRRKRFAHGCRVFLRTVRAAYGGKGGPRQCADWVLRSAVAGIKGARQAQLRGWMPLCGGPQVIFRAARGVLLNAKAKCVDVSKQEFSLSIARIGGWNQIFNGLNKLSVGERITRGLHIGLRGQGKAVQNKKRSHGVDLWFGLCFAGMASAQELPKPLTDAAFLQFDSVEARLGQLLFYDPLLSGNRNISCATCHSPVFGTGDGVALSFGEGGAGLGPDRVQGDAIVRQSRNAPALWNLGAADVRTLFHDGRVARVGTAFETPAGGRLPEGLNSVLAAQSLFPMIAQTEMAGDPGENDVASAQSAVVAWSLIAGRVANNDEYREMFDAAFGSTEIKITHVVNALAAYIDADFRAIDTPFDRYLVGAREALTPEQVTGLELFYGRAGCYACHSGPLLSDQDFHSIGTPVFGPGLTRQFDPVARDMGRMAVTDDPSDAFLFRTPFLRNVAKTAPYGHNGAFQTLQEIIKHHADPETALAQWTPEQVALPQFNDVLTGGFDDFAMMQDQRTFDLLLRSISIRKQLLNDAEVSALVAFLNALSDDETTPMFGRPETVPSGLSLD